MGLCVRQQWFMFPRPFTATERDLLELHLTVILYVLCVLYSYYLDQPMHYIY
jgi:hypothetical protein